MTETNELKPCPFCGGEAELQNDIGHEDRLFYRAVCADIDCQGHYCNLWSITPENAAEMWNTRYKRTCHVVSSRDYWDEYERYVTHVGWKLSCGHETITEGRGDPGDPSSSQPCFCSACGAEVVDA